MAFDQNEYIVGYVKQNYDRIEIRIPKGKNQTLKDLAQKHNMLDDKGRVSVSRLIVDAIEEKYNVDLTSKD